ncbi:(Fe-S)-binding protein [bacterium]|nr:(Fe-S)-binding protein [bacterium]
MKQLVDFKKEIHKCSKCGLCQAECPIYKITGNDCSVSRGQFIMLKGFLKGELKLTKTINRYLDLCLKCGACTKFCPSGIDVVDIIIAAKSEYFKLHFFEKIKSFFQKYFVFGFIPNIAKFFRPKTKSKTFSKKILYFGGCGSKFKSDKPVVKILNSIEIEVINPDFSCCGIPYFSRGDLKSFNDSIKKYIKILKKYEINKVVTTCASCEKSLKDYVKWAETSDREFLKTIQVKNIYEYLKESQVKLKLKMPTKITYHKPCNINNWKDIEWLLKNTENLEYIEMKDFDKCCGLNGISKIKEFKILSQLFKEKQKNIINTHSKRVLTSCLGCEIALKAYSFGHYKTQDLLDFISNRI